MGSELRRGGETRRERYWLVDAGVEGIGDLGGRERAQAVGRGGGRGQD